MLWADAEIVKYMNWYKALTCTWTDTSLQQADIAKYMMWYKTSNRCWYS